MRSMETVQFYGFRGGRGQGFLVTPLSNNFEVYCTVPTNSMTHGAKLATRLTFKNSVTQKQLQYVLHVP